MMQIEKQREEYYKSLGTPPGVPTIKGATADPDNTGRGYNDIIGELGDHSVPEGWVQRPKFNEKGDVPGPPVQWQKPEDPDNAQPGYGYIPTDTTNIEEIFFYHSDHLGSTSYITDAKANITQFDAYLPYGELLVDEHSSSEEMPYKFNGKELDQETGLYYYGARYMNPVVSIWYGVDALKEKYPSIGGYIYCAGNPIKFRDKDGKEIEKGSNTVKGNVKQEKSKSSIASRIAQVSAIALVVVAADDASVFGVVDDITIPIWAVVGGGALLYETFINRDTSADKELYIKTASEHTRGARKSTADKHTKRRAGTSYGQSRNDNRGNKNKKYQKKDNPNKRHSENKGKKK